MKIYYDADANPDEIRNKKIAIIGFGSQGHAHALNLKESGANVVVGLREGASWRKAEQSGLKVMPTADAVKAADVVFGCFDKEAPRLILTELCAAYGRNYVDVASDVLPGYPPEWGGRVCTSWDGAGCLVCLDELDVDEAGRQLAGPEGEERRRVIYGVETELLAGGGPSVVSVNGVVASLAVTEFMAGITGLRNPHPLLTYRGSAGIVSKRVDPLPGCYYCAAVRDRREAADVERYIRDGVGKYL